MPFEMGEDRHARFLLHAGDEALAAARHDHVDGALEPGQHLADGGPVGHRHHLDRRFRQAGAHQPARQRGMDGKVGADRVGAAAQDHRVAGLKAQRAGIRRHVGPALVDHADDAERRAHALDMQPVRPVPGGDHRAYRIVQRRHRLDAGGNRLDALLCQRAAVEIGGGLAAFRHRGDVLRIRGQDLGG